MSLQSLAAQHRAAILARERQTNAHLQAQYEQAQARILARSHWLFSAMRDAKQHEKPLPLAWLYQFHRARQFKQIVSEEIGTFARIAHAAVLQQKRQAREQGRQDALLLLQARKR